MTFELACLCCTATILRGALLLIEMKKILVSYLFFSYFRIGKQTNTIEIHYTIIDIRQLGIKEIKKKKRHTKLAMLTQLEVREEKC